MRVLKHTTLYILFFILKKIQELQKTILIERQQNKELTVMLERRSQTDDLADCYLNELLLSRYQSHCNNERQ